MPLNANIPMGFQPPRIESPLEQMGKVLPLMQMLEAMKQNQFATQLKQRQLAQQEAYRSAVSSLPENATEEEYLKAIRPYVGPDDLNKSLQSSLDRRASLKQKEMDLIAQHQARLAEIAARAQEGRITRQEADQRAAELRRELQENMIAGRKELLGMAAALRPAPQPQPPVVVPDGQGGVKMFDRQGNLIKDLGKVGAPSATVQKAEAEKVKTARNINEAITELGKAVQDGGLIDKSTGSGAGALVDKAAGFIGMATPGAVAVGQLQPIFDIVLKMVPRFEGPQSDKDTQTYKEAAGQLANPNVPNKIKKEAGKTLLRLMQQRRDQFVSKDSEAAPPASGVKFLGFE